MKASTIKWLIYLTPFIWLIQIILLLSIFRQSISNQSKRRAPVSYGSCITPDGSPSKCYNIRQCPRLLEIQRRYKEKAKEILRQFLCRPNLHDMSVCCPIALTAQPRKNQTSWKNVQKPPICGNAQSLNLTRIVNSVPVSLGNWPWTAALGYRNKRNPKSLTWHCGGSLVTNKHIITAAHCTSNAIYPLEIARLGDLDLNENNYDGASPESIKVIKTLAHPSYKDPFYGDDIAIVFLQYAVQFTRNILPICLPTKADLVSKTYEGTLQFVVGWGKINFGFRALKPIHLQQSTVQVVKNNLCKAAYRKKVVITQKQLCARGQSDEDACIEDSGGPLMWINDSTVFLIGTVSYGHGCSMLRYPGVYTRITSYLDWINNNLV